jgi:hypothetical protein
MQCPRCDADNPSSARYCTGCGKAFPLACPLCGRVNAAEDRFCGGCGHDVGVAVQARPVRVYTPAHLAERILVSRRALEGERKQVTVLFADL